MKVINNKPIILQQFFDKQINNGGPATGALLLLNSNLKEKYIFIPMNKTYPFHGFSLKLFIYFFSSIKKVKPDIVHIRGIQSVGFFGVLAAKLLKCKVVLSVHGLSIDTKNISGVKRFLYKHLLERYALRKADLVYCVCEYACNRNYIKENAKNLFGFIHNAAPAFKNKFYYKDYSSYRETLGINEEDVVVTIISRITQEKGFDELLNSIPDVLSENKNIKFIIGGEGDYLPNLKLNLIDFINARRVIILGKISNVNEVLLASDIFVFPSHRENLSNSLLEASATGLPIVATNVGGNSEIVKHEETGILIDPYDTKQLTQAILKLAGDDNLRIKYGRSGLTRMENCFSQDTIFNKISNMYDSLLKK